MSFKAYLVELKNKEDVDYLHKYLSEPCIDGVVFLNHVYKADEKLPGYLKDTLVAAVTADRPDLQESMVDEAGLEYRPMNIRRLEELPDHYRKEEDYGFSIRGWSVPEWSEDTWVTEASRYLLTVAYGDRTSV